ncbi:MAG: hypothetical protein ACK519_01130 [Sphingomonadaceae bacterium]
MTRLLISITLLFAPLAPARAYWEYGHETVAHIAQANMSPKARAHMQRLLRAAPMLGTPTCAISRTLAFGRIASRATVCAGVIPTVGITKMSTSASRSTLKRVKC